MTWEQRFSLASRFDSATGYRKTCEHRNGDDGVTVQSRRANTRNLVAVFCDRRSALTFAVAGGVGNVVGGGLILGVLARLVGATVRVGVTLRAQRAITDWLGMESGSEVARQSP